MCMCSRWNLISCRLKAKIFWFWQFSLLYSFVFTYHSRNYSWSSLLAMLNIMLKIISKICHISPSLLRFYIADDCYTISDWQASAACVKVRRWVCDWSISMSWFISPFSAYFFSEYINHSILALHYKQAYQILHQSFQEIIDIPLAIPDSFN